MSLDDPAGGKRALVTGAGSGIGRATAIRLAAEGVRVACAARRACSRPVLPPQREIRIQHDA